MIIKVLPNQLHDNPYQVRLARNLAKFDELKASIRERGILEKPIARKDPKDATAYQLAFGHGRRDAWAAVRPGEPMEVEIQQLTDQQMFDYSWAENHDREDLSPIEEALLLQKEGAEFHLTQKQLAERHKNLKDQGSISNKLALLYLPDSVRMMVHRRELAERQARQLIPFAKISPKDTEQTAREIRDIVGNTRDSIFSPEDLIRNLYNKHANPINTNHWSSERKFLIWPRKPIKTDPSNRIKGAPDEVSACNGCPFMRKHEVRTYCFRPACLQTKKNLHAAAERKAHPIKQDPPSPAPKPKKEKPEPRIQYAAEDKRLIKAAADPLGAAIPIYLIDFLHDPIIGGWISPEWRRAGTAGKRGLIMAEILGDRIPCSEYAAIKPAAAVEKIKAIARKLRIRLPKGWNLIPAGKPKKSVKGKAK
jgi:ParB/RepB/Spo0J family partition protein